jgi:hypothetical protein
MNDATKISEVDYKREVVSLISFLLGNALVFAFFAALWVWQYHIGRDVSARIDRVVVPFGWLAGFYTMSFVTLRRAFPKITSILMSIGCALLLSWILFLAICGLLAPFYDPMGCFL